MSEPAKTSDKHKLYENAATHLVYQPRVSEPYESPIKDSLYENGCPLTLGMRSYLNNLVMYADTQKM